MPLTSVTNVGILRSTPGHNIFSSFVGTPDEPWPSQFSCTVITNDEADNLKSGDADEATLSSAASLEGDDEDSGVNTTSTPSANPANTKEPPSANPADTNKPPEPTNNERPALIPFDLDHDDLITNLASQDDARLMLASQAELLPWHH
jgi:hypothetical protein